MSKDHLDTNVENVERYNYVNNRDTLANLKEGRVIIKYNNEWIVVQT